jgi:hypothetical protein
MATGKNDFRNGYYVTSEQIKARLDEVKNLDVEAKEPEYNLFIVNTPNGQLKIKSKLSLEEWMKKYQSKASKKNIKTFNTGSEL